MRLVLLCYHKGKQGQYNLIHFVHLLHSDISCPLTKGVGLVIISADYADCFMS